MSYEKKKVTYRSLVFRSTKQPHILLQKDRFIYRYYQLLLIVSFFRWFTVLIIIICIVVAMNFFLAWLRCILMGFRENWCHDMLNCVRFFKLILSSVWRFVSKCGYDGWILKLPEKRKHKRNEIGLFGTVFKDKHVIKSDSQGSPLS